MSRSRSGLIALALTTAGSTLLAALSLPTASAAPPDDRSRRADQAVRAHPEQVALDGEDALVLKDEIVDPDGTSHVRFDRTRSGLPVLGGDLVVHQANDGALRGVSATTRRPLRVGTTATVTRAQAERTARDAARNGATSVDPGVLEIDSRDASAPSLVWAVVVHGTQADQTPSELLTLVDARSGQVVDSVERVETAADDTSRYSGQVSLDTTLANGSYSLLEPVRGVATAAATGTASTQETTDLNHATTGTGVRYRQPSDVWSADPSAVDVHYGAAKTYDYYASTFGRKGIRGDGVGARSRVHYGTNYNNAFWQDSCFCMTYGDGDGVSFSPLTELDVAGHEMSHGVMAATAALTYSKESGGLNEANSDIFGTLVEFSAKSAVDTPDYLIGELIRPVPAGSPAGTLPKPLRYMDRPSRDGSSADCWSRRVGNLDVHASSGVGNHFFYLLAEGSGVKTIGTVTYDSPTCGAAATPGVGQDAAAKIWYRAITVHMTSSTNFGGARAATIAAAKDLAPGGSAPDPLVTATAPALVGQAWDAAGVTASVSSSGAR